MKIIIFFILHWYLSLFVQTFYLHRYAAHRMFTMNGYWDRFFFFLTAFFQGSSFLSPRAYAIMHRLHHSHADTENDPHSPSYSKNLFDMMWKTKKNYVDILKNKAPVEEKYIKNIPEWPLVETFADSWKVRILWMLIYTAFYVKFATLWWIWLLLPVHFLMGPIHGVIINWYAHKYGYINFKVNDTAKNLLPVDFLMMGECYHNNHHKFGGRPNFGVRWFEIDLTYYLMLIFSKLGILKLRKGDESAYM